MKPTALKRKTPIKRTPKPKTAPQKAKRTKAKSPKKKTLRLKADAPFRKIVVIRWGGHCAICGKATERDAHHLITRGHLATRYSLENGILLCPGCHTFSGTLSAHMTPLAFSDWLERTHPELRQWEREHRNDTVTATVAWYEEQIERLTEILARLEAA